MITVQTLPWLIAQSIKAAWRWRWGWYAVALGVILWSNHLFREFRVLGNIIFVGLPVVGSVMLYLWLILLIDELVDVLGMYGPLVRIMRSLKTASLFVVAAYGALAGLLWLNGQSGGPVVRRSAQVLSAASTNLGLMRYAYWTVRSGGPGGTAEKILRAPNDSGDVYVGGDAELVLRQGRLLLWRVLEVRRDEEKYHLKMLVAAPASQIAMAGLVRLYAERREFEKALHWYAALTRLYPNEPEVGYGLGAALVDARRYRQAVDVFRRVLAVQRDYETLYALGYALAWAGEKHEATTYLREAAEMDPEDFRALYSLGYVLRDTGRYTEAKVVWSKVLQLMPNFPEVVSNLRAIESRIQPQQ